MTCSFGKWKTRVRLPQPSGKEREDNNVSKKVQVFHKLCEQNVLRMSSNHPLPSAKLSQQRPSQHRLIFRTDKVQLEDRLYLNKGECFDKMLASAENGFFQRKEIKSGGFVLKRRNGDELLVNFH